ncbi:zinc-binding alcohol dehydrogenase family protein [Fodinisporobacter ferrooxydans]|uniref:Zinc-binding alcohol dehydrogenase family protein n=1 Tax=Fodinisporobacter ferrooxydans TaxID=2901836 RepID=A0ABY4CQQ6_9BACL|nr:zinc-binding alcohol dehydrogenase family protein [Alicyclobacillaceae bacterium MYW30-H2]
MKCIVCEQPNQFQMIDVDKPKLQRGQAIIRIRRIGICGTDFHAYKGNQPYFTYPRVLGHELSGTIEEMSEIGENPYGLRQGDQVAIIPYMECGQCIACRNGKTNCCTELKVLGVHMDGGMCEWLSVPIDHLLKTEGISLDQTALLEPLSIGAHAVRRSDLKKDEVALVIGAGPIGLGVMAFAKQRGAKVIAMDINEERLQVCRNWANVDHTVYGLHQPDEAIAAITNGEYPTVVFDATGNAKSMMHAFRYVAHGGKLVFVGLVKTDITFSDPEFHKREMTVMGSRNAAREDFELVMKTIQSGELDLDLYITHRVDFSQTVHVFDQLLQPESNVIKAIIAL